MPTSVNEGSPDGLVVDPIVSTLLDLAERGAPALITSWSIFNWWLERRDRMKLQGERDALLERVINSQNSTAGALKDTADGLVETTRALAENTRALDRIRG